MCAILAGVFYCLRISELDRLTWEKLEIGEDIDGDTTLTLSLTSSKTDQFNEGATKVLKTPQSDLRPVRMLSRWKTMTASRTHPKSFVFGPHLRTRLAATLRLAGVECNVDGSRLGAHSMRSGGASAMFTAGYEVEVIKRRGRWSSNNFQSYIWKDHYVMSSIGRGMMMSLPLQSLERGGAGGGRSKSKGKGPSAFERSVGISHALSKALRRKGVHGMLRDGFVSFKELLRHPYMIERNVTREDVYHIVRGGGKTTKTGSKLELYPME